MYEQAHDGANPENRRRHPRMSVHWHGSLSGAGQEEDCIVLDISQSGARVQSADPFDGSSSVVLQLAQGDRHDGSIVWRQGSFMGLEFAASAAA